MNLNPVDIIIALIWLYFIYRGYRTGFILQLAQITSIIAGYICANMFHLQVNEYLIPYINNPSIRNVVAYISILFIVVMIVQMIAKMIHQLFSFILLGWLNRLLGILLGALKGLFITSLIIFTLEAFPQSIELRERLSTESILFGICDNLKDWTIQTLTNEELLYKFQQEIKDKTDEKYIQEILNQTRS
jgi:membrane protein required for colicin V production